MEKITFFLANNYKPFVIIAIILICALTGYIVDNYERKKGIDREAKARENDLKMVDFTTVDQSRAVYQEDAKADLDLSGYNGQVAQPQTGDFVSAEALNNMNFDVATPMTDPNATIATGYVDTNVGYTDPNAVATATYADPAMYNQPVAETTSTPTLQIGIEKK